MHHRAPATPQATRYDSWRWRKGRFAVALLCLVLVCLFAGISAVHAHPFSQPGTSLSQAAAPCELCAVAFQPALLFYARGSEIKVAILRVFHLVPTASDLSLIAGNHSQLRKITL
jgi:hypothetical protein